MIECKAYLGVIVSSGMNLNKELKDYFLRIGWRDIHSLKRVCMREESWQVFGNLYVSLGFVLLEQGEIPVSTVLVELLGKLFITRMEQWMNYCRTSLQLGSYICTSRFYASCNLGQELVKLSWFTAQQGEDCVYIETQWHSGVHDETSINDVTTIITSKNGNEVIKAFHYNILWISIEQFQVLTQKFMGELMMKLWNSFCRHSAEMLMPEKIGLWGDCCVSLVTSKQLTKFTWYLV